MTPASRAYEFEHIVGFQETNFLGNVYFVHPIAWQGRCRELFLRDEAPEVLQALADGLQLLTARCSCEYLSEMRALDRVLVRMRLGALSLNRIVLSFEYWLGQPGAELLAARGEQEVVCMRAVEGQQVAAPVPEALSRALSRYA